MKSRVSQLASRIAQIQEDFSKSEIQEALRILEERGSTPAIKERLLRQVPRPALKRVAKRKTKPIVDQRSKAVVDLHRTDQEKFLVLSEFDSLLRKRAVLPEVVELKMFGKSLSKTFSSKSSRREIISKLMSILAEKPLPEIREVIRDVLTNHRTEERDSDYYHLAQFIITGKPPQNQTEHQSKSLGPQT